MISTPRPESPGLRTRLTGRRHGRKLRRGLQGLLDELLPRIAITLPEAGAQLDLSDLFGSQPRRLWVEIGFGAGEHLVWQAKANPEAAFLGAEIYVNGIAAALRSLEREGLSNIRILQGDGIALLDALPDASVERVTALFPDPWPKARHHKRRLIQAHTLDRMARVMRDDAELRVATDHRDYLRWILDHTARHGEFVWTADGPSDWRVRGDDWPATRYETKAIEQGRMPVFLRFLRRARRL